MSRLPQDTTKLFCDIWNNAQDFLDDWKDNGLYEEGLIKDSSIKKLFYLLYSEHGNSAIANLDEEQFKYRVYAIIFQYGKDWERKLEIQKNLLNLNEEELRRGGKAIYNTALNPSVEPGTASLEELPTINQQNTTNYKKSVIEGYSLLLGLLDADVTKVFINRFDKLFAKFVRTRPALFISDEEEE